MVIEFAVKYYSYKVTLKEKERVLGLHTDNVGYGRFKVIRGITEGQLSRDLNSC